MAAAKGLIAGQLIIVKKDETIVDCRVGTEVRIPPLSSILQTQIQRRVFYYRVSKKLAALISAELVGHSS